MKKKITHTIFFLLLLTSLGYGQEVRDTIPERKAPATRIIPDEDFDEASFFASDTLSHMPMVIDTVVIKITRTYPLFFTQDVIDFFKEHPYFNLSDRPVKKKNLVPRNREGKEDVFYLLSGLLLLMGVARLSFPKYFNDLIGIIFRTSFRQKQVRDQMLQAPAASIVFNLFFFLFGGLYLFLVFDFFDLVIIENRWAFATLCSVGLIILYYGKFLILKFISWIFNIGETIDVYTFLIFYINKMIGLFLVPIVLILAFADRELSYKVLVFSWFFLGGSLIYRYVVAFSSLKKNLKVSSLNFFIYVLVFEVSPMLLIYKSVLNIF